VGTPTGLTAEGGLAPGRHRIVLVAGDLRRRVVLHLPAAAEPGRPLPLVLALHASGSSAVEQLALTGLEGAAERHGVLVAAPQGALASGRGAAWNVPHVGTAGAPDDEAFVLRLLDALADAGLADPDRVLVAGLSGGARLACQLAADHADRVTLLAPVAGLRAGAPQPGQRHLIDRRTCAPGRPVPLVAFHGTADPVNPYEGGGRPYWGYPVPAALARWAELNGCEAGPTEQRVAPHVVRLTYTASGHDGEAVLYVVEQGGHTWPGSRAPFPADMGAVTREVDATAVMMLAAARRFHTP
jgi:polyhydroxybutyrate depolymerase